MRNHFWTGAVMIALFIFASLIWLTNGGIVLPLALGAVYFFIYRIIVLFSDEKVS